MITQIEISDKELADLLNAFFDEYRENVERSETWEVLKARLSALGRWQNKSRGRYSAKVARHLNALSQ